MKAKIVASLLQALVACTANHAFAETQSNAHAEDMLVIKADGLEWRFLLIDGTTMLPTEYVRTGEKREEEEEVRLAPFWIASAPITRRQFAEIMGKTLGEVPKSCFDKTDDPNAPVDSVTWVEAYEFCERFNAKYCRELPKGYLLQLPISIEWAHAVRTLEKKGKFAGPVGCMLFTRTGRGGFLRTYSDRDVNIAMRRTEIGRDYVIDYVEFPPHVRHASVGFRPILSPICGEDGKGGSLLVTRGTLLAYNGFIDKAERTLKLALAKANLKGRERERAEECLEWLASKREYDYVDWISMWDMPDCAKRFFEIDALQDWCNEDKKARYGEFEEACREAIAMKMEPPVWYYNLACALAVQGKRDEAFDALEQAVVAGYNKVEHAKCDSDFDTISDNPRFSELLQVMGLHGRSGWQWAKKQTAITNDVVELTADNVYFGFNKH